MSLSRVGGSSAAATSIAIPAHQAGDLIVIWAFRDGSTTPPTVPTAGGTVPSFTTIDGPTGANLCSAVCAYAVAAGTTDTSGTWTNATGMSVEVWRGQGSPPIGDHAQSGASVASGGNIVVPAITPVDLSGASVFLSFAGHRNVTAWNAPPAGYTQRSQVATECEAVTKDTTTSDGSFNLTCTASGTGGTRQQQLEILADQGNRVTQQVVEVITSLSTAKARITQQVTEVLSSVPALGNRVTQQVLEVLVRIPKRFTVTFSGSGTFAATVLGKRLVTPSFLGVGTFTATIRGKIAIHPTFAGHGTFSAVLPATRLITATFHGIGTFVPLIPSKRALTPSFLGHSTFSATIPATRLLTPSFSGHGSFAATVATSSGTTHDLTPTFHGVGSFRAQLPVFVPASAVMNLLSDGAVVYPAQTPVGSGSLLLTGDAPRLAGLIQPTVGVMKLVADPAAIPVISAVPPGVVQLKGDAPHLPSIVSTSSGVVRLKGDPPPMVIPLQGDSGRDLLKGATPVSIGPLAPSSGILKLLAQQPILWILQPLGNKINLKADRPTLRNDLGFEATSGIILLLSNHPIVTPLNEPSDGGGPTGTGIHIRATAP